MATIGGARAVRWDDAIGSLKTGKQADVIIVDTASLNTQPLSDDPYHVVVKTLRGRDVETVIVNGRLVMDDRRLLTIDEAGLLRRVQTRVPALHEQFREHVRARGRV
jgi:cytosine/adenosine deaminase-related metal-dependent hydrolase